MLNEPTVEKLRAMRLGAMADAWFDQQGQADAHQLSFDERFGMLVDAEFHGRENRRLDRLLRAAKLRISNADLKDIDTPARRGIERPFLLDLGTCNWIHQSLNVLITGATGVGKSYLACSLGHRACQHGHRVLYRRVGRLLDELTLAHASGEYIKLLARLAKIDVLILDDWGIGALTERQRHDILEVLEDRYAQRSTVVTSQLPITKWHDHIGDPSIADAVLDRLVHNAHKIQLKGPSRRKENAVK